MIEECPKCRNMKTQGVAPCCWCGTDPAPGHPEIPLDYETPARPRPRYVNLKKPTDGFPPSLLLTCYASSKSPTNNKMTPSKSEEILAVLWFILATQLHGWMRWMCVAGGGLGMLAAVILAMSK